ncbi:MAG: hypothetical protein U0521_09360 [Anaerolineae bacterium]
MDFHAAYDIPELTRARPHTVPLDPQTGAATSTTSFAFAGDPLPIKKAFVTWRDDVDAMAIRVIFRGQHNAIRVTADGAAFTVAYLERETRENERSGVLKRITTSVTGTEFTLRVTPI